MERFINKSPLVSYEMASLEGDDILYKYELAGRMHSGGQGRIVRLKRKSDNHVCVGKFYNSPDISNWDDFDRAKEGASKEIAFLYKAREEGRTDVPLVIEHGVCGILEEPLLVMEEIPGRTLEKILSGEANFSLDNIFSLARGIGGALTYAHNIGTQPFVHRDVKPANIMVTPDDEVVVLDWSTAKVGSGNTQVNTMFNSLYYSAPEVMFGRSVSPASDVYSLAKVLEHCILGQRFIDSEGNITKPNFDGVNISAHVFDALLKATNEKPEERYQSIDAFLSALNGNGMDESLIAQPTVSTPLQRNALQRGFRRVIGGIQRFGHNLVNSLPPVVDYSVETLDFNLPNLQFIKVEGSSHGKTLAKLRREIASNPGSIVISYNGTPRQFSAEENFRARQYQPDLWNCYLDSCTGFASEKGTKNLIVIPVCKELVHLPEDFSQASHPLRYSEARRQGTEFDLSLYNPTNDTGRKEFKYNQQLTRKEALMSEIWLAILNGNSELRRDIVDHIYQGRNEAMGIYSSLSPNKDSLRAVYANYLDYGSGVFGDIYLCNIARFLRAAPRQ